MAAKEFIKGYNDGYLLSRHEPQLSANVLATKKDLDYFEGSKEGKKEYEKKILEQLKTRKDTSKDKDIEI